MHRRPNTLKKCVASSRNWAYVRSRKGAMTRHRGYQIAIERTNTGYGAVITPGIAVCVTGRTKAETTRLAHKGIDLWIEFAPMSFEEAMAGAPVSERRRFAANRTRRRIVRAVRQRS